MLTTNVFGIGLALTHSPLLLSLKGDLKEGFDLAMELPADDKDRIERGASLYGPNFWPDNLT
ncbi:unnamed protein product, partial [Rotaria sp. Silwood2]